MAAALVMKVKEMLSQVQSVRYSTAGHALNLGRMRRGSCGQDQRVRGRPQTNTFSGHTQLRMQF